MALADPIESYPSVAAWARALKQQWGGDPMVEDPEKLRALKAFCHFIDKDPDQLVAFCFLRRKQTGERFGSVQRREKVLQRLSDFTAESKLRGIQARRLRSQVISFLSHNGLLGVCSHADRFRPHPPDQKRRPDRAATVNPTLRSLRSPAAPSRQLVGRRSRKD